jgi:hypothetical protein
MLQCIIYGISIDMCKHSFALQQCYSAYVIELSLSAQNDFR